MDPVICNFSIDNNFKREIVFVKMLIVILLIIFINCEVKSILDLSIKVFITYHKHIINIWYLQKTII